MSVFADLTDDLTEEPETEPPREDPPQGATPQQPAYHNRHRFDDLIPDEPTPVPRGTRKGGPPLAETPIAPPTESPVQPIGASRFRPPPGTPIPRPQTIPTSTPPRIVGGGVGPVTDPDADVRGLKDDLDSQTTWGKVSDMVTAPLRDPVGTADALFNPVRGFERGREAAHTFNEGVRDIGEGNVGSGALKVGGVALETAAQALPAVGAGRAIAGEARAARASASAFDESLARAQGRAAPFKRAKDLFPEDRIPENAGLLPRGPYDISDISLGGTRRLPAGQYDMGAPPPEDVSLPGGGVLRRTEGVPAPRALPAGNRPLALPPAAEEAEGAARATAIDEGTPEMRALPRGPLVTPSPPGPWRDPARELEDALTESRRRRTGAVDPKVVGGIAVAGTGALMSQSHDEKIKATGIGLMGLAALHAIGTTRMKAAGSAIGGAAVDALKTSETGKKILNGISHDILADPKVASLIDAYHEGVSMGKAKGAELSKEASKLGPSGDRQVSDLIEKEAFEPVPLGTDQTAALAVAQKISDEFTQLGRSKAEVGLLSPETIKKREGSYLPRMYAGPLAEAATGEPPKGVTGGQKPRIIGDKQRNDDLTPSQRVKLGEVRESSFRTAVGIEKGYRDVAAAKLFSALSEMPGVVHPEFQEAAEAITAAKRSGDPAQVLAAKKSAAGLSATFKDGTDGYVKLPDTPGMGVLRGAIVRQDVADYLNGVPNLQGKYGSALKLWKRVHTVLNPGTHVGNTMSNGVVAHMTGLPMWEQPMALKQAWQDYKNYSPSTKYLAEKGVLDRGLPTADEAVPSSGQDLKPALQELARTTKSSTASVLKEGGVEPVHPVIRGLRWFNKGAEALYAREDGVFRVATFDKLVKGGMPQEQAAKVVDEAFVNYNTRSPLLGAIKNTVSPFVMYPVKAIPYVTGQIIEHPVRWMTLAAAWGALDQYSQHEVGSIAQQDLRPDQRTNKAAGYLVPGVTQLPFKNERGDRYAIDVSRWTPFSALTGSPAPGSVATNISDKIPALLQPSGPLVDIGARATNTDPFTGDKWIKPGDNAVDKAKKVVGAAANFVLPSALSFHAPRIVGDLQNDDPKAAGVDALGLAGMRPSVVRPGMETQREVKAYTDARTNIVSELRAELRKTKSPARQEAIKARAQKKLEALAKEFQQDRADIAPTPDEETQNNNQNNQQASASLEPDYDAEVRHEYDDRGRVVRSLLKRRKKPDVVAEVA